MSDPNTRFIAVWQSKNLLTEEPVPRPVLLSPGEPGNLLDTVESVVFLGEDNDRAYFAIDLQTPDASPPSALERFGCFRDLRAVAALLDGRQAGMLAYARAITYWHSRNRFCGDCGSPNISSEGGHMRVCSNERCRAQRFPRTDPAIIVLISAGERCLLGRQSLWPKVMYSTIAGFVEPGESLEHAVEREALEETGVRIGAVHYHSSQPWPFPCSIMLGFMAQAVSEEITLGDNELEDARWLSREDMEKGLKDGWLRVPRPISIAYRLIEDWFNAEGSVRLRDIAQFVAPKG